MKTTVNKTIPFKQRDNDKNNNIKPDNKSNVYGKVIPYPRFKKKKEKSVNFIKSNKIFFIILSIVLFFSLIFFIDTTLLKGKIGPTGRPLSINKQTNIAVSDKEFKTYSEILEKDIVSVLSINSKYNISPNSMHKNGDRVYVQGDIHINGKNSQPFDAILDNSNTSSIVINGDEYVK
ncbi:hypothetical protein [Romboutsia sp. MSSM.1001216sp_RTP31141st1_G3_RTP31141_220114]|uniref:hypothetical protein n=1 Tax=unclassified Romboutsia TaxID=2626894 RepID=UPI0031B5B2E4